VRWGLLLRGILYLLDCALHFAPEFVPLTLSLECPVARQGTYGLLELALGLVDDLAHLSPPHDRIHGTRLAWFIS